METFRLNVAQYLQRIHIHESLPADEASLIRITRAHLEAIPFENLEVRYEHQEPSLEPFALFQKIIVNKRGGYCFELNKLFYLLLKELGYECYPVAARVVHMRPEQRPVSHRGTIVVINGRKWFCDVGFGGAGPKGALRLDTTELQEVFGDTFYVEPSVPEYPGEMGLCRVDDGVSQRVLVIRDMRWIEADFNTLNGYYATYPRSPFMLKRILYRCTPTGWISLTENTFTIMENNVRQTVELHTEQEIQEVLEQRFELFVTPL